MQEPANAPEMSHDPPGDADSTMPVRRSRSGIAGVVCSTLGCLGWIGLVPFLDPCDQGEQLARFFAALFNVIVLAVFGGAATILLLVGLTLSRRSTRQGNPELGRIVKAASILGFAVGGLVLVNYLPAALMILS